MIAKALIAQIGNTEKALASAQGTDLLAIRKQLAAGREALEAAVQFIVGSYKSDVRAAFAGSVPYLKLTGIVLGGWQMARAALVASEQLAANAPGTDADFLRAKIGTARFFADHILSQASGLASSITEGAAGVMALAEAQF